MKTNRGINSMRVVLHLAVAALTVAGLGTAAAHETEPKFTLNVFDDAAYGRLIKTGRAETAIEKITTARIRNSDRIYAPTNLCVAYVVTRDLENAGAACDDAIDGFEQRLADISRIRSLHSNELRAYRRFVAIAYSNRGVLRAINGERERARADFEKAQAMETRIPAPEVNLARLAMQASLPTA